jgi:hypothetical protein
LVVACDLGRRAALVVGLPLAEARAPRAQQSAARRELDRRLPGDEPGPASPDDHDLPRQTEPDSPSPVLAAGLAPAPAQCDVRAKPRPPLLSAEHPTRPGRRYNWCDCS